MNIALSLAGLKELISECNPNLEVLLNEKDSIC